MKRYFITGLICLLPFVITIFLLVEVLNLITDPFVPLAEHLLGRWAQTHPALALVTSRILVLLFASLFTLILGTLAQKIPSSPPSASLTKPFTKNSFDPGDLPIHQRCS